ncbi:hypothetical protein TWF718_000285 [Orbilia javanica]|uniref:rRNA methyltransferase 1, mitochondrial n=1 Tax=Orbilia javanica TaxID=47235 RepID=A0AAN8RRH6_9PEZI
MYRGIAHPGLSRISTSCHASGHINLGFRYGCRQLSSTAVAWKSHPPSWMLRGNSTSPTPNVSWTATPPNSEDKSPWPDNPGEVTWSHPAIRKHVTVDSPRWDGPPPVPAYTRKPQLPNFRGHSVLDKEDGSTKLPFYRWPSQSYSPLDGELESWAHQSGTAGPPADRERESRQKFLAEYDARPHFRTHGESHYGGFYADGREEMTVLKKPAKVLPFSTATSEFLYGYNICKLAMKEQRRQIYKLYVYGGLMRQAGSIERERILKSMATDCNIPVISTMDVSLLDAMSKGRPHNGFALEAEPLEIPKVGYLVRPSEIGVFNAPIHQSSQYVQIRVKGRNRRPFVLVLDEVLDGGNFGAILRSAYFLGVDAVFIVSKNSTPATAVTSRSSAGALECIDYYDVGHLPTFIGRSQLSGWKFYGAMPAPTQGELRASKTKPVKWYDLEGLGDPASHAPVALVLGNEADGLRPSIQKLMDAFVTIRKAEEVDEVVDSLNVGVAASILTHAFLYPAAKGAKSEPVMDRRTERKVLDQASATENTLFKIDDGKYTAPKYEGANRLVGATAGGKPSLLEALKAVESQEVEENPLKGWNPDDEIDGLWEEEEAGDDILGGKEKQDLKGGQTAAKDEPESLKENEEGWEGEIEESSSNQASIRTEEATFTESKNETIGMTQEAPKDVSKPPAEEEAEARIEMVEEDPNDDENWEDIDDIFEGIENPEDFEAKEEREKEKKPKKERKSMEWDDIKPREVDFTTSFVGPSPVVIESATSSPSDAEKSPSSGVEKKEVSKKKKKIPQPPLIPKRLLEIAAAKGMHINGVATKKQKKILKKEGKKLQQELRKKVRDDAAGVRSALNGKKDPTALEEVKEQSEKRNYELNERKKGGKAKQNKNDKSSAVKEAEWNFSEAMR